MSLSDFFSLFDLPTSAAVPPSSIILVGNSTTYKPFTWRVPTVICALSTVDLNVGETEFVYTVDAVSPLEFASAVAVVWQQQQQYVLALTQVKFRGNVQVTLRSTDPRGLSVTRMVSITEGQ